MVDFQEAFHTASNTISEAVSRANAETANDIQSTSTVNESLGEYPYFDPNEIASEEHSSIPGVNNITEIQDTTRFSSAIWYKKIQEQSVCIAGVGGIGSYCVYLISRMKPASITLFDPDRIDVSNLAGQLYDSDEIGEYKVEAAARMATKFCSYYKIFKNTCRFGEASFYGNILICGFDNMQARKSAYYTWKRELERNLVERRHEYLYIDGRLSAEEFQVFCITGDNDYLMERYEKEWLFDDSEAEETVCSYKQTSFTANMIASVMVNLFVNFCANLCEPLIYRDLPFLTRYDASTMFFKTE